MELITKAKEILKIVDFPERHTFYQIDKFIIGKEPTAQAQLWAIIREIQARVETVEQFKKDLLDSEDNLELFDIKIERLDRSLRQMLCNNDLNNDLNIKEHEINIRKLQRDKDSLVLSSQKINKKMQSLLEEIEFLLNSFEKIEKNFEKVKPLDDEQAQKEMWNEKLLEEFNLRLILQRPLDPEFIKTVLCLHDDAPVKKQVVTLVQNIQKNLIAERSAVKNRKLRLNPK